MRIVIAPQSFKSSVSALNAAQAIERGVKKALPDCQTFLVPVADGGDGTLEVLVNSTGGQIFRTIVTGPLGHAVEADWGVMGDGQTAVIEMARASGLAMVPHRRRSPRTTTTYGTGELIRHALDRGFDRIVVGMGGSATNDAGMGMASALGAKFVDERGNTLPRGGASLAQLERIDINGLDTRLSEVNLIGATDVTNPLCGPTGASAIFGPQKGATPDMVTELDGALANFARVAKRDLGIDFQNEEHPGAGAAGGLGAGLMAFSNCRLQSGIDLVCEVLNFDEHVKGADLVLTGEGRADLSSIYDKAPVGLARKAAPHGVPTVILAGSLGDGYRELYVHGIAGVVCIADRPMSFERSLARTEELLEDAAERTVRLLQNGRSSPQRS